jgi:hypothetical protein
VIATLVAVMAVALVATLGPMGRAEAQSTAGDSARAAFFKEMRKPGTIAIAASGPRAGEAVFRALEEAEKISSGSIHGVAWFMAMTKDGKVHRFSNFGRGGTKTMFINGEETGTPPPAEIAEAPFAGVVSTGPRDPTYRIYDPGKYPNGGDDVGFVVGHRLPNSIGKNGLPVDHEVFSLMQKGLSARAAVDRVMGANEDLDVGLIAVDRKGLVAMHNSALVDKRYDYGRARGEDPASGAVVETIFNEIHPPQAVAQLVVNVALEIMSDARKPDFQITVKAGTKVGLANENVVEVDGNMLATRITTTVPAHLTGEKVAVIPYILTKVVQQGKTIGYTINEPLSVLQDGVIKTVSTQKEMKIWVKKHPRVCKYATPSRTVCEAL